MAKNKLFRFSAKHTSCGPTIGVAVVEDYNVECYFKFYDHFAPASVEVLQSPDYKLSYNSLEDLITSCLASGYTYVKFYE